MKKLLSFITVIAILLAFCVMPASATTEKKSWEKMTGPGTLSLNEEGVRVDLDEGLTFYKYTAEEVDVKDFTCKFKVSYENYVRSYFSITLMNGKAYSGKTGLFILMRVKDDNTLDVEGQIINTGYYLTDPDSVDVSVNCKDVITMHGKDNGNGTYTISFDGANEVYTFEIPENYQFTEDLDGKGYLTVGGTVDEDAGKRAITVISYNDLDFSGNKETTDEVSSTDSTSSDITVIGDNTNTNTNTNTDTDTNTDSQSSSNTVVIVACVCGGVVVLAVAAIVVVVMKKKKTAAPEEEKAQDEKE